MKSERPIPRRQELDELVVNDLHDLLARGEALEDLRAQCPLADPGDEVLDDPEGDVGLEGREAELAHRRVAVGLGHPAATRQGGERAAQAIAELVEHGRSWLP